MYKPKDRPPQSSTRAQQRSPDMLLQDLPGMVYQCANDQDWTMQFVSAGALALTGYSPGQLTGDAPMSFSMLIHPDDRAHVASAVDEALRAQRQYRITYRIIPASGPIKWVVEHGSAMRSEDGSVAGLQGFLADITAERAVQESSASAFERFRAVALATNDGVWDWDLQTSEIWWNEGLGKRFGFSDSDFRCGPGWWRTRIHPDDRQRTVSAINAVIDGDTDLWGAQYRLQRQDGSYAHIIEHGYLMRGRHGKPVRLVAGISDITESKQAKQRLSRLNRSLEIVNACNERLIRATDETELLEDICRVVVELGGYSTAWVGFAIDDAKATIRHAACFGDTVDFLNGMEITWDSATPSGNGPTGITVRSGQPFFCADIQSEPSLVPWAAAMSDHGYRSGFWLPLKHAQKTYGVLAIYMSESTNPEPDEAKLLQTLADNLAFGVANLRARAERAHIERTMIKVAAGMTATTSQEFFEQLAHNVADALDAQGAIIAEFMPGRPTMLQTVVTAIDGSLLPNFAYSIVGTPWEQLLNASGCVTHDDLHTWFPDSAAAAMNMRGYIGCRLDNRDGRTLGVLVVLYRGPADHPAFVERMLPLFATRAAAELERRRADVRIREQASLLDRAKDAIIVTDDAGHISFWNMGAERLYGWTAVEALEKRLDTLLQQDRSEYCAATESVMTRGQWQGEQLCRRKDGLTLTVETNSTLVQDQDSRRTSILSICTDISQRKAAEREIQFLAFHDRLTELPNRHLLMTRLERSLEAAAAGAQHYGALLCIDLDNFKNLNDTRGHDVGDVLLRHAAARIRAAVAHPDTVARLGGDEFVVLITGLPNDLEAATDTVGATAQRVLDALREPYRLDNYSHHCSASIGIVLFLDDGRDSAGETLKRADLAMYRAKASGRNGLCFFDAGMQAAASAKAMLEADLRVALQLRSFHVHYQPQLDHAGRVTGLEALARWPRKGGGWTSPAEFIPLAEETGLIVALGCFVLEQACTLLASWAADAAPRVLKIAVNVSVQQFRHPDFVAHVMTALERTGASPALLTLELTESLLADNIDDTIAKMMLLKAAGISFSLDDFGTGYSSLAYLKQFPLDVLKIDQSFVRDIMTDADNAAIARTVVALGHILGLEVIAEGVETVEQRNFLLEHGCRAYQGYLFSRPLPMPELNDYLDRMR